MKKILTFLTAMILTSSITTTMVACQKEVKKELNKENIHEQIKEALSEPLDFNDDWIIDYDSKPEEDQFNQFVSSLVKSYSWTYLTKTVSFLVLQRLKSKLPNLFKLFPDFTMSTAIIPEDEKKINGELIINKQAKFHYNLYYNLQQLQKSDFSMWSNWEKGRGIIALYDRVETGEYSLTYEDGIKNQVLFKQKNFIVDDQSRLDYLTMILAATPSIKIFNEKYRSFAFNGPWTDHASTLEFSSSDFAEDITILLRNNPELFPKFKSKIQDNLIRNMKSLSGTNVASTIKYMKTIFKDISIDIELIKAYSNSDIKNDEALDYIYGSHTTAFPNGMLLLKIKSKLKSNGSLSTNSIDETIALNIKYVQRKKVIKWVKTICQFDN